MKIRDKIEIKTSLRKTLHNLLCFFKKNVLKSTAVIVTTLASVLLLSFGFYSSSKSQIESIALSAANIAKNNSYQKVHFASQLKYYTDGSFSENCKNNGAVFTKAHQTANKSFVRYSSAAFMTRNNFYNIPSNPEIDSIDYLLFDYSFLNTSFSLMNITPSTNSEITKKYTTPKYVDGVLIENYSAKKTRLETIDLFLLCNEEKPNSGFP